MDTPISPPEAGSETTPAGDVQTVASDAATEAGSHGGNRTGAGRKPGSKNRKTLERENDKLRKRLKALEQTNPFGAPPKDQANAATETPPAGEKAPDVAPPTGAEEEVPPLGIDGAKALAPAYYGIVNVCTKLVIKNAPALKNNPAEAARIAGIVQLDGRAGSSDREAIDPPLLLVLAKLRLTPEWALVLTTGGVLLAKYALATGDKDALEVLQAMNPAAQPAQAAA